ncbi:MAG: peptide deformylase [Campylobacterales bacterium]|nr:peptide deformylase [Campylobacterales bacterium]
MVREIVIYPDKRLKEVSQNVECFEEELHTLLDDMYETMIAKNGVGLAAVQVGIHVRALIINIPVEIEGETLQIKENTLEMINPVLIEKDGEREFQEGCLSVPGIYEDVTRCEYVKVEYQDRFGEKQTIEDDDFLAIAMQHEMDHLDGKVFVEKLSYIKRKKFEKEWKKLHP